MSSNVAAVAAGAVALAQQQKPSNVFYIASDVSMLRCCDGAMLLLMPIPAVAVHRRRSGQLDSIHCSSETHRSIGTLLFRYSSTHIYCICRCCRCCQSIPSPHHRSGRDEPVQIIFYFLLFSFNIKKKEGKRKTLELDASRLDVPIVESGAELDLFTFSACQYVDRARADGRPSSESSSALRRRRFGFDRCRRQGP